MKIIGIIAEYNPFHNGHAYQIKKIKEDLHADAVVVAMSGDFVQRGAPALIDKYARARMALSGGADLVVELPVLYATASAESFAMAGVALFEKMGCVDGICFGTEADDFSLLEAAAAILATEPDDYRTQLALALKQGKNFPAARAFAISAYLSNNPDALMEYGIADFTATQALLPEKMELLFASPNNILAIEYLKAIRRRRSSLKAYPLKREGAGYHETAIFSGDTAFLNRESDRENRVPTASASGETSKLTNDRENHVPTASASGIRRHLFELEASQANRDYSFLADAMPKAALSILEEYRRTSPFLTSDDFSAQLGYILLSHRAAGYTDILDCNRDISNRISRSLTEYSNFSDFCEKMKSKDITYTRMSRILLHLLLNIDEELNARGKNLDYIPYLRILGIKRKQGEKTTSLFSLLKETSSVPLISKLSATKEMLSPDALSLLEEDIFAADFYEQVKSSLSPAPAKMQTEYERQIVVISSEGAQI